MWVSALLLVASGAVSCGSDATGPGHEPDVFAMRVSLGAQPVTVDATGAVLGDDALLRVGENADVAPVFTDRAGVPVAAVVPGAFRLDMVIVGTVPVTYTPSTTNSLNGTLLASAPVSTFKVRVSLFDLTTQRTAWGPFTIDLTAAN
jgi:hypothetical protein